MPRRSDPHIDSAILNILLNRQTAGYNEVYRLLEKTHRHVSLDAFDRHIRGLRNSGDIERKDTGAKGGKIAQYCITDKGRQTLRLFGGLEKQRRKSTLRLERAFQLLLFFEANKEIELEEEIYGTEDDLLKLVRSKYPIPFTKEDLVIEYQFKKEINCSVTVYLPIMSFIQIVKEEFDIDKAVAAAALPDRKNNRKKVSDGRAKKGRRERKYIQNMNYRPKYALFRVKTLGVTIRQVLDNKNFAFHHLGFSSSELQEAFTMLKDEEMIKSIGILGKDIYYSIADDALYNLIRDCWIVHNQIMEKVSLTWMYFRGPTWQERKWLEIFRGPERAKRMIKEDIRFRLQMRQKQRLEEKVQMQQGRQEQRQKPAPHNNNDNEQQSYAIENMTATTAFDSVKNKIAIYDKLSRVQIRDLKEKHERIIRKYHFPYERIMNELVYPVFLQDISSTIPHQQN